jgi:hypothetical protein
VDRLSGNLGSQVPRPCPVVDMAFGNLDLLVDRLSGNLGLPVDRLSD